METTHTTTEWDSANKIMFFLHYFPVGKAAGVPARQIRKFNLRVHSVGDGQWAWRVMVDKYVYEREEMLRTGMNT